MNKIEYDLLKKFFTESRTVVMSTIDIIDRSSLNSVKAEPFLDAFTIKINANCGAVYDGDKIIACIGRLNGLIVDPQYRGRSIGTNLIVTWFQKNTNYRPSGNAIRTVGGQNVYTKAWNLLALPVPTV